MSNFSKNATTHVGRSNDANKATSYKQRHVYEDVDKQVQTHATVHKTWTHTQLNMKVKSL